MNAHETTRSTVNLAVHPKDQMFTSTMDRYLLVGSDALRNIKALLNLAGRADPHRILDLASGCGRVTRHLRNAYPAAQIVASDIMPHAVEFCEKEFDATPDLAPQDFSNTHNAPFDLIWSGSLMTHLDEEKARKMLALMIRSLSDNGVAIWTTHGRYTETLFRSGRWSYKVSSEKMADLVQHSHDGTYGYHDYDHMAGYGISVTPLPWLARAIAEYDGVRMISVVERGWDSHQDVIAIIKRPI